MKNWKADGFLIRSMALVLVLLLTWVGVAMADCTCTQPSKPELPSARADAKEMAKSGKEVDAFNKAMKGYRDCILSCLSKADADLSGVITGWNYAVDQYNAAKKETDKE